MAKYIYQWKPTEHGRRLFRSPAAAAVPSAAADAPAPEPEPEPEQAAYDSLKKDQLVGLALERGLDASGTKADIVERLESDDE